MTIRLTIDPRVEGRKLVLDYEVVNESSDPIALRNALFDWHGDPSLPPVTTRAYVNHAGDDRVVLFQGNCPVPDPTPFEPHTAMFRPLAPGERFAETIIAKLPLREWDAYEAPRRLGTWPVKVSTVELRVDYRVGPFEVCQEHEDFPGNFVVRGGTSVGTLSATAKLAAPVKLARRVGQFDRFA